MARWSASEPLRRTLRSCSRLSAANCDESLLVGARLRVGHQGVSGGEVFGGSPLPCRALHGAEKETVGVHRAPPARSLRRPAANGSRMGRALFFDSDEEDRLPPLAADRLDARQDHARNFGDAILQGRLRRRDRVAGLEVDGGEDPFAASRREAHRNRSRPPRAPGRRRRRRGAVPGIGSHSRDARGAEKGARSKAATVSEARRWAG